MITKFEVDVSALTFREGNKLLDSINEAIEVTINHYGYDFKLRPTGLGVTLKYIVEDV